MDERDRITKAKADRDMNASINQAEAAMYEGMQGAPTLGAQHEASEAVTKTPMQVRLQQERGKLGDAIFTLEAVVDRLVHRDPQKEQPPVPDDEALDLTLHEVIAREIGNSIGMEAKVQELITRLSRAFL